MNSKERVVCILDRSGDVDLAAKTIICSRVGPDSTSPFSPDLVLVNEYIKDVFITRCLDIASTFDQTSQARALTSEESEFEKILKKAEVEGEVTVHGSAKSNLTVIEVKDRYKLPLILRT